MPADLSHGGPLLLSLLALAVGPLCYWLARSTGHVLAGMDGFVYVTMGGLVLLHIMPESFALAGWAALIAGVAGLVLPGLVEHRLVSRAHQAHSAALVLGLVAIGLHAFLDGLALVVGPHHHVDGAGYMLPVAVILHRLPVGLTIWLLVRPQYGPRAAAAVLGLIAVCTALGFAAGEPVHEAMASSFRGVFQAGLAGSLLHVLVHRSYPVPSGDGASRWASGLGALAGVALLGGITTTHAVGPVLSEASGVFLHLVRDSAVALVVAYAGAGLIHAFMPATSTNWMKRGTAGGQALRGMAFGLPLPICSCGVVPVYRSMVAQGVPATAAMAFLVATPELSLDAVLISVPLLGGEFTAARVAAAAVVALTVGWAVGRSARVLEPVRADAGAARTAGTTVWARLRAGLYAGFVDVVDDTAPWILVGLGIASLVHPLFRSEWLQVLPPGTEVLVFALLGMPTYVCASGATPLVAVLIYKGVSPGAALAFLLTGPATNITTFGVLSRLHGRRLALAFGAWITVLSVGLGLLVNRLLPDLVGEGGLGLGHEDGTATADLAALLLAAVFAWSLVRRGPRAFVGELYPSDEGHDSCGDGCGHSHGGNSHGGHSHGECCHEHDHDHGGPHPARDGATEGH